jgi:hypothetical protein
MRGPLEVADIFRSHGPEYREAHGHEGYRGLPHC